MSHLVSLLGISHYWVILLRLHLLVLTSSRVLLPQIFIHPVYQILYTSSTSSHRGPIDEVRPKAASYIWCISYARWHTAPELNSSPSKLTENPLSSPFHSFRRRHSLSTPTVRVCFILPLFFCHHRPQAQLGQPGSCTIVGGVAFLPRRARPRRETHASLIERSVWETP